MNNRLRLLGLVLALAAFGMLASCARRASLLEPRASAYTRQAPDSFDVEVKTTKGDMRVRVHRAWSPHGADRFYVLTQQRYFDDVAFHRVIRNFVAQFGIHGLPAVSEAWRGQSIPDDSVRQTNRRGTLSFARSGPNTRSVQLFFNLVDNTPRLDTLNGFGFPPLGEIVTGLTVLDSLTWEYSGTRGGQTFPGPSQDSIGRQGNDYLKRAFPKLDYIRTARVVEKWGAGH